ncbi:MAG: hypothetical protein II822_10450 [Prevotella sp.]|nr:hypothetical protein [Prevotella sp.]
MTEKTITIQGQQHPIAFNGLALSTYEEVSGKSFFEERFTMQKARATLIYSCIIGADEKADIDILTLMKQASWKEMNEAFVAAMQLCTEWFDIPAVVNSEQPEMTDEEKANVKN